MESRFKIFSDPVHGFISVPRDTVLELIQTPEVQRLRRIRQLGVGYLVFPGAEHTRFGHALGAMALMQEALSSLCDKGTAISPEETTAALLAALLHDIGHGPFSHTLENELIDGFRHEQMSRIMLEHLNERFGGRLDLAIAMFDGVYPRPFFHQLVSSQIDMDRLDYLRRDSFYTGVIEGSIGVGRIIKTMRVHPIEGGPDSGVVIESKGVYAAENFIISRRLMYWQVYLHKTVLAGDHLLRAIFSRVREHLEAERPQAVAGGSEALLFFLRRRLSGADLGAPGVREAYTRLDDTDVLFSIKVWRNGQDNVLADLCDRFINRRFFRVQFLDAEPGEGAFSAWRERIADWLVASGLSTGSEAGHDAGYYLTLDASRHTAYEPLDDSIRILRKSGEIEELSKTSDTLTVSAVSRFVVKPYLCFPKEAGSLLPEEG